MTRRRRGLRQKMEEKTKLYSDGIPGVKMDEHHDEISANVPKLRRTMFGGFQKIVNFHALITPFRGSSGIVSRCPGSAAPRRGVIKPDIGLQRDAASSAVFGGRTGSVTGTGCTGSQWAAEFGVLAIAITAVGFHFQASIANRNAVRANGNTVVIGCLFCVAEVEVNERLDVFTLAKLIHRHRIMSRVEKQLAGFQRRSVSAEAEEGFAKTV